VNKLCCFPFTSVAVKSIALSGIPDTIDIRQTQNRNTLPVLNSIIATLLHFYIIFKNRFKYLLYLAGKSYSPDNICILQQNIEKRRFILQKKSS